MVEVLQARCLALAGVMETDGDGERLKLQDLKKELEFWEAKVARQNGTKPRLTAIKMGGV